MAWNERWPEQVQHLTRDAIRVLCGIMFVVVARRANLFDRLGDVMKRSIRFSLLTMVIGLAACALAWLAWDYMQVPPLISYESWARPRNPEFPLSKIDPGEARPPLREKDLLSAGDFVFTMGVGSGWQGLDVFRVNAKGNATYVFATGGGDWWKSEFNVTMAEVARLRQLLVEVDYRSMASGYHADVCDGTQWCIRVDVAGATKKVYCDNYFPGGAEKLASIIRREVLPAHEAEISRARRIWESTAQSAAAGLW